MAEATVPELHQVTIVIDPRLVIASEEHQAGLIREFRLIEIGHDSAEDRSVIPRRLAELIVEMLTDYQGVQEENLDAAHAALGRGDAVVKLEMLLPAAVLPAVERISDALEEADEFCRGDNGLLTTPATDEIRAARRWFVDEIRRQLPPQ